MLKLLILTSCIAAVSMSSFDKYVGKIVPVTVFPLSEGVKQHCFENIEFSLPKEKFECKCNDVVVPVMEIKSPQPQGSVYTTVLSVEKLSDIQPALDQNCTCETNISVAQSALLPINNDFFLAYTIEENAPSFGILYAKEIPTPAALDNVLKSEEALKDTPGFVTCTTETDNTTGTEKGDKIAKISDIKQFYKGN